MAIIMADLRLGIAMMSYDTVRPLIEGEVKVDGITLDFIGIPAGGVSRVFYDQIKFQRYDVSEMCMSSFLRMRSIGWPYRILPVFHNCNFSYTDIKIRKGSGIRQGHPEDLKGKRFGIAEYDQSRGLWIRGVLQMEWGVKPEDMIWYQERGEHFSHSGATYEAGGLPLPKTVEIHYAKKDFRTMFLTGELDAAAVLWTTSGGALGIERGFSNVPDNPDIVSLFPDPRKEALRFFKKTGLYQPNHAIAVRESILEEHPWVGISLMAAFEESKRIAFERYRQGPPPLIMYGQLGQQYLMELEQDFGTDPFPWGIKANAKVIDMVQTFSVQQGLSGRKQPLDKIFPQELIYREERL